MTNSDGKRDSAVMMSSAMPSAKYSWSGSALIFVNGSTAIDGLSGRLGIGAAAMLGGLPVLGNTRKTCTGSAMFLTDCKPASAKAAETRDPTCSRTVADTQIPPGSASACSRAATLTASPNRSPSRGMTSPQ